MKHLLSIIFFSITFPHISVSQIYLELEDENILTFEEIVIQTEAYFDIVGREKGSGYTPFKRWKYWSGRSLDINGKIISKKQTAEEYKEFANQGAINTKAVSGNYTEMGPMEAVNTDTWSSHIGRVSAIAIDPNDSDHIIVGSPTGGVWKSIDKGLNWTNLTDAEPNIDIWSLTISHSNSSHYYIGTGIGIKYSLDGGTTWLDASGEQNTKYNTLVMHPTNSNVMYAVAENSGRIYKSTDGGLNWVQIYDHTSTMYDLEFKPGSPNTIYASGRGIIIKSDNAGISFSTLNGAWSTNGAIMLAVTPDDSDYLYALQEAGGGFDALYRSTNSGSTFAVRSDNACDCNNIMGYNQSSQSGQAPRDMDVIVSPTDKEEVHVAGVETWKASNGGTTWTKTTSWLVNNSNYAFIHADVDALYYLNNTIYAATDGGIFYSEDEANTFTDITQGLGIRQFYRIGVSETDPNRVSGGSQDNGTGIVHNNGIWYDFMGADGMETFIDYSNQNIVYGSVQYGSLYKSTDGGNTASSTNQTPGGNGAWVTPLEQDPMNPNTLYQAKYEVFKSTNGASSWSAISNFDNGNLIQELALAPSDNNTIYTAFNNSLHVTIDGGSNWTDITPDFPLSNINYLAVHPTNPMRVSVVLSGSGSKIIESEDGGTTWSDLSGNLPNVAAYTIAYEGDAGNGMYIGMNPGIFYKNKNTAGTWTDVSGNLPRVRVVELEIRNNKLYAGTYGRGLWRVDLAAGPIPSHYSCAQAQPLSIACGSTLCSIAPDQGSGASQPDATDAVWYIFTPERTGVISVYSCGVTSENTRLYVHGGDCSNLSLIDESDNNCNTQSRVDDIAVVEGIPLYIEWDNKHSNKEFEFIVEYVGPTCDNYEDISSLGMYTTQELFCYGASQSDATSAQWYRYTSPTNKTINIFSCNGGVDTRLWIYSGDCNNLTPIGNSDDSCTMGPGLQGYASSVEDISVTANTPIYIEWDNRWSNEGFDWFITSDTGDWYRDADNDSFGDAGDVISQQNQPSGYVSDSTDCDDTDSTVFPGAPELCDGQLNDCNSNMPETEIDNDNDDYVECSIDAGGWDGNPAKLGDDCDDTNPNVNPRAPEICDNIDNNCDNQIDEGLTMDYYNDNDGDGFGAGSVITTCSPTSSQVLNNTDCDDTDSTVFPGALEICDNLDNNCDNQIDEGLTMDYYNDNDGDGFGAGSVIMTCSPMSSQVLNNTDCDDTDSTVFPGAQELCDGQLNNCNGNMLLTESDDDNDGYVECEIDTGGWDGNPSKLGDDCDDTNPGVNPEASEICDNMDNNCNNQIDEGIALDYYNDNDGDGFGAGSAIMTCSPTSSQVLNNTDCDDTDPSVNPNAIEVCGDNFDNDCDGIIDYGCIDCAGINLVIDNGNIMAINRAEQTIISDALVNLNSVLYTAGDNIELQSDFEVASGKVFEARIEPCNPNVQNEEGENTSRTIQGGENIKWEEIPNYFDAEEKIIIDIKKKGLEKSVIFLEGQNDIIFKKLLSTVNELDSGAYILTLRNEKKSISSNLNITFIN